MATTSMRQVALVAIAGVLVTSGCASHKEPAIEAVADIETSLNALREEGRALVPAQFDAAEARLASLKDSLAKGDYKAVVDAAPAASSQVAALQEHIVARRLERESSLTGAAEQWRQLSIEVPQLVAAIEARVGAGAERGSGRLCRPPDYVELRR